MLKLISWNLAHKPEHWLHLLKTDAQVGLLQEACAPSADVQTRVDVGPEPWQTGSVGRPWRACVARLDDRVALQRHHPRSLVEAQDREFAVSRPGTLAAAEARDPETGETFTLVSMYAPWERPHASTGGDWMYADASAHRLISDLSVFIGQQRGHRIIAAGDLNILHGYGEQGRAYWAARYQTVFDRMAAIGLRFLGPQSPNGKQAHPRPDELPSASLDVPTFRTNRGNAETATRQLDFVFASEAIAHRVHAWALNSPDEWGPSDHCMVRIEIAGA